MEQAFDLKKEIGEEKFLKLIESGFFKSLKKQPTIIYKHIFFREIEFIKNKDLPLYNLIKNKTINNKKFIDTNEILLDL